MQFVDESGLEVLLNGRNTATEAHIFISCGLLRSLQSRLNSVSHRVKLCPALHLKWFPLVMSEYKCTAHDKEALRPPSSPRIIRPRAPHRPKHVASQNPRANIFHSSPRPFVIHTGRATVLPVHLFPRADGEEPLKQLRATNS